MIVAFNVFIEKNQILKFHCSVLRSIDFLVNLSIYRWV